MAHQMKEEDFLQKCFVLLSKFSYEKLKETLEKEKEDCKTHTSLVWSQFLSLLISYADYEKSFYSLTFLGASNFGVLFLVKKETALKTKYNCLLSELRKIELAHKDLTLNATAESPDSFQSIEQMVSVIGIQLQYFVVARVNTICFYEQLTALTSNKNVSIDDLLKIITTTLEEFLAKVNHPLVDCFKKTFKVECEAVINLLKTQAHLQKCVYFDSLMSMLTAGNYLTQWSNLLSTKEGKKLTFMNSSNKVWMPELYDWLVKLKGLLLSKFNFYFFEVLCKQGTLAEVKTTMARAPIDYVSRIASFFKKADVCKVLLVLTNLKDLGEKSRRQGYFLPSKKEKDSSKEMETAASKIREIDLSSSRPTSSVDESKSLSDDSSTSSSRDTPPVPDSLIIYEHPSDKQEKSQTSSTHHLPAIEELLSSKATELEGTDKIVCASDPKSLQTYVMTRIEGTIVLVIILNKRHVKPDTAVTNFLTSISSDLRCSKLFLSLKPGSK